MAQLTDLISIIRFEMGYTDTPVSYTHLNNLDQSFADNRPKALVQMATGAGKTFTAITAAYRLLK